MTIGFHRLPEYTHKHICDGDHINCRSSCSAISRCCSYELFFLVFSFDWNRLYYIVHYMCAHLCAHICPKQKKKKENTMCNFHAFQTKEISETLHLGFLALDSFKIAGPANMERCTEKTKKPTTTTIIIHVDCRSSKVLLKIASVQSHNAYTHKHSHLNP